ncbi:hypothetical protein [Bowmanella dokdonensis]|uniref:Uncharacterized protein n=1 Tax=Bowmanella dokdonensis TaxID=751969 RepID=A0A939DM34_9ALTE|nr:hypothetical protein [Bowmanella dokdonensis]MBN7824757.1 hypothetical protein [Bowmanella dokdonensis]
MSKQLMDQHPLTERILAKIQSLQIQIPETADEHWKLIEELEVAHAAIGAEKGFHYLAMRERVGHGEFLKELDKRGLPIRRVQEQMQIARFLGAMPEANARATAHLKPSQLLELSKLPEPKKEELTPEEIEEYSKLPYRKIGQIVKQICLEYNQEEKLAHENQSLKRKLEQLEIERFEAIQLANQEQLRKAPQTVYGHHPLVAHIKQVLPEASEHATQAAMLGRHFLSQLQMLSDTRQARLGAEAMYYWLETSYRQLGHVLAQIKEQYPTPAMEEAGIPVYDPNEWSMAESKRQLVTEIHKKMLKKRGAN